MCESSETLRVYDSIHNLNVRIGMNTVGARLGELESSFLKENFIAGH